VASRGADIEESAISHCLNLDKKKGQFLLFKEQKFIYSCLKKKLFTKSKKG